MDNLNKIDTKKKVWSKVLDVLKKWKTIPSENNTFLQGDANEVETISSFWNIIKSTTSNKFEYKGFLHEDKRISKFLANVWDEYEDLFIGPNEFSVKYNEDEFHVINNDQYSNFSSADGTISFFSEVITAREIVDIKRTTNLFNEKGMDIDYWRDYTVWVDTKKLIPINDSKFERILPELDRLLIESLEDSWYISNITSHKDQVSTDDCWDFIWRIWGWDTQENSKKEGMKWLDVMVYKTYDGWDRFVNIITSGKKVFEQEIASIENIFWSKLAVLNSTIDNPNVQWIQYHAETMADKYLNWEFNEIETIYNFFDKLIKEWNYSEEWVIELNWNKNGIKGISWMEVASFDVNYFHTIGAREYYTSIETIEWIGSIDWKEEIINDLRNQAFYIEDHMNYINKRTN